MPTGKERGAAAHILSLADRPAIVTVAVAAGSVAGIAVVVVGLWRNLGDVRISTAGWVAMALGILAMLAVGIGLMALIFISNRRGYDEPTVIRAEPDTPNLERETTHGASAVRGPGATHQERASPTCSLSSNADAWIYRMEDSRL